MNWKGATYLLKDMWDCFREELNIIGIIVLFPLIIILMGTWFVCELLFTKPE